jgi:BMFP domain-containing protein YqiC
MGYYVITILIKRKDNKMLKTMQEVSLKSLDMINKNADGIVKLAEFLHDTQKQLNMLATKVLELEEKQKKTIEELSKYERSKN